MFNKNQIIGKVTAFCESLNAKPSEVIILTDSAMIIYDLAADIEKIELLIKPALMDLIPTKHHVITEPCKKRVAKVNDFVLYEHVSCLGGKLEAMNLNGLVVQTLDSILSTFSARRQMNTPSACILKLTSLPAKAL